MSGRPRLLFLAPAAPAPTGNGLAMRGWAFLEGYAATHDVDLVILPLSGAAEPSPALQALCRTITTLPASLFADPLGALLYRLTGPTEDALPSFCRYRARAVCQALSERLEAGGHTAVHVQRLYLAPAVAPLLDRAQRPQILLDLDDDDALTFQRLADLHRLRGELRQADACAEDARRFAALTARMIDRFDWVAVCSDGDARRLGQRFPHARFAVIPNAPPAVIPAMTRHQDIDLLFVGTFGYLPNRDGAEWLITRVLPLLPPETRLCLAGACETALQRHIQSLSPAVTVTGRVEDLAPYYARSRLAVVPVRAGGGTRIKILEAVAYGLPVVSTSLGAEGLPLRDGEHLLLADTPDAFARACLAPGHQGRAVAAGTFLTGTGARSLILGRIGRLTAAP